MEHQFTANIHLLTSGEGGRKSPLLSSEWRTVLGAHNERWSARLTFSGEPLPGQSFTAFVQLLRPDIAFSYFPVGAEFTVWEGGVKGKGTVTSVAAQQGIQADAASPRRLT